MAAQKPLQIVSNVPTQVAAVESSAGSADEGKIVALNSAGQIDPTMLPDYEVVTKAATEDIAAGAIVSIWSSGGTGKMRNADATADGKRADGFVVAAVSSGANGTFHTDGIITGLSGLTPGAIYYITTTPGTISVTAPSTAGNIVMIAGKAISTTELEFKPQFVAVLA